MRILLPLDITSDILIFSPQKTKFRQGWTDEHTDKKQTECQGTSLSTCLSPPCMQHCPFLVSFFDDRQWQSRAELHGSCLSSGCNVWCVFDVVQAHRRPRLWLLAHDTKLRRSWNLEGRKEGSTLPRQSTQKEKQQPVITQSVLIHCDTDQGLCWVVVSGFKKERDNKDKMENKFDALVFPKIEKHSSAKAVAEYQSLSCLSQWRCYINHFDYFDAGTSAVFWSDGYKYLCLWLIDTATVSMPTDLTKMVSLLNISMLAL